MNYRPVPVKYWQAHYRIGAGQRSLAAALLVKGWCRNNIRLSDGSAIRLTIARYYTPLGRSIQRSYEKGKKVYMDEMWERFNSGEMLSADSLKKHNGGKRFTTSCKDTLFGGDGITPNIFVPIDTSNALSKNICI